MSDSPLPEEPIFLEALEFSSDSQRASFLNRACGEDQKLRGAVEALLKVHSRSGDIFDVTDSTSATIDRPILERPGTQIGPYKLQEQIGEGGMGVVYLATQREPLCRKVALKIIKPGMDTREVVTRFEAERQTLALMDHPNIAKVFDAGATEAGRPYFAMELVKGSPITEYCDRQQLSTRERLALFVTLCHGVQHAHQKGVIHRDLKPSNLLVEVHDARPIPKIIDFGIAKAVGQQLTEKTFHTAQSQMVGTPLYMSPEQAGQSCTDVDTRSDIYSLGVLLYELLTGSTPFDKDALRTAGFDEMRRIIREVDPPRPSARVSTLQAADLSTISERRHVEPRKLHQQLRGDLDLIVMKAMEKDPARRYESASALATDVQRYLNHEPVQARRPTLLHCAVKWTRRHRPLAWSSAAVLTMAAVAGGALFWTSYRRDMLLERDAGEHLAAAGAFLRAADYIAAGGELANARGHLEAVQYGVGPLAEKANALGKELATTMHAVEVNTRVTALIDESQRLSQGLSPNYAKAVELLSEAMTHRPHDARLLLYRGSALGELGRYDRAIGDLEQSLQCEGGDMPTTHLLLASAAQQVGDGERAQVHRELGNQRGPGTVESLVAEALATPYSERGVELLTQAIAMSPFDPALYYHRGRIAYNLTVRKSTKRNYEMAIADLEKVLLDRPRDARIIEILCLTLVQFGQVFDASGEKQYARAKQLLDEWLATDPDNTSALAILADWQTRNSTLQAVLATCEKGRKLDRARPEFLLFAGWGYTLHGQPRQAIECFTKAIEVQPDPDKHIYPMGRVDLRASRAQAYARLGEQDVARKELQLATSSGVKEDWTFYDWDELINCYRMLGDAQAALRWSDERALVAPDCPRVYEVRSQVYLSLGRLDEARADFDKLIAMEPKRPSAWTQRARVYVDLGQWEKALADFGKALELRPDSAEDCNNLAWYLAACPDPRLRQPDRAVELAKKATQLALDDRMCWNTLGVAQYRAGDYQATIESLTKSMEWGSGGTAIDWFFLAMAHKQLGNREEARQWYDKAVACMQTNKPDDVQLHQFQAEAAALLGVTLPTVEPAPEPAAKVEAQEWPKSTPAPEPPKTEEPSK